MMALLVICAYCLVALLSLGMANRWAQSFVNWGIRHSEMGDIISRDEAHNPGGWARGIASLCCLLWPAGLPLLWVLSRED